MLTFFLVVYIAQFDLAFFVASIFAFGLASYLTFYSTSVYLASTLAFFSGILSGIYHLIFFSDILFCHSILSFYFAFHLIFHSGIHLTHWDLWSPAVPTEIRSLQLSWDLQLRRGRRRPTPGRQGKVSGSFKIHWANLFPVLGGWSTGKIEKKDGLSACRRLDDKAG